MNLGKLTNIVLDAIKSRKDKTNKITQLAMAINGTYVEDTTYVDDRILWMFMENGNESTIKYSNISKIVEKANSLKFGSVGLFLTEKLASKFSILAGLTGVVILDFSQKDVYDTHVPQFTAMGIDITGLVLAVEFNIGELDNNTKFTYNGIEYTLLPAEEEPTVTAPIFDSLDLIGTRHTASHFLLGDNMVFNETQETTLISPLAIFFTQEQRSKISMSVELNTNEYTQEELVSEIIVSTDNLGDVPFNVPENAAYILHILYLIIEMGQGNVTSFTITYDGVDYVYDSTNVLITRPEEEPEVDTLYSVDCQSTSNGTFITSSFNLGDNITVVNSGSDSSISPYALLLTSEQAQNFSISVTGKTGVSQEDVDEAAAELQQLVAYSSSGLETDATISQFATEHNITHVCMMTTLLEYLSAIGGEYVVLSSAKITYNGHTYVYDLSKIAVTNNETEQLGE